MNKLILHIDFNSYFASVEQQANPRLRGKPIGVTGGPARNATHSVAGGDRMKRTVLGAASVEAKTYGVRTGMQLWEARRLCPQIILVPGDSDKYLECTKRFLSILSRYSPGLEVFSIDEVFMEIESNDRIDIAKQIKSRIRLEIGEWIRVSIGISYNKLMAKLAGSLQKPDGLVIIPNEEEAIKILDKVELDDICGIGGRIKHRLNKMGIFNFKVLRQVPKEILVFQFKSYGQFLYNAARGIDYSKITPFYEKEEVKSVGHRHTIDHDTADPVEVKQILLKLTELVARRLRAKKLVGKTISCWFRYAFDSHISNPRGSNVFNPGGWNKVHFTGDGMQITIPYTNDGLEIFNGAWKIFHQMWDEGRVRMLGVSISNLKPLNPENLSFLDEVKIRETITKALDKINDKYGEFTLKRGILLGTPTIKRMPNPFLADRRFKL